LLYIVCVFYHQALLSIIEHDDLEAAKLQEQQEKKRQHDLTLRNTIKTNAVGLAIGGPPSKDVCFPSLFKWFLCSSTDELVCGQVRGKARPKATKPVDESDKSKNVAEVHRNFLSCTLRIDFY
jgi:hypothetical protein